MASYSYNGNGSYGGATYGHSTQPNGFPQSLGAPPPPAAPSPTATADAGLRRRTGAAPAYSYRSGGSDMYDNSNGKNKGPNRKVVERLDILFPKVDQEFIVKTKSGGIVSMVAWAFIGLLCTAEIVSWMSQNGMEASNTVVDTSLGKQMRVNINITFPALACEDLHVDVIDIAGDSKLDVEDTLKKKKLHLNGKAFSTREIEVETNQHRQIQKEHEDILKRELSSDYCGPCYGAQETEDQCCQTCDEVVEAYKKKRWKSDLLKYTSEQCVREGRNKVEPKKMTRGQGCNLAGYMMLNRVSGNFHIAMGEGVERDGRHIHSFLPEDAPNFNASHIIHQLSFGPPIGPQALSGSTKIVTESTGTTGLFQYFIKVVPTTYVGDNALPIGTNNEKADVLSFEATMVGKDRVIETNRYFSTERFMPLMTELIEEHEMDEKNSKTAAVHAGHTGGHTSQEHHSKRNAVLPGVFFIYEIYPFAVEIRRNSVPLSHLLIRLMATIGGVITILKWLDSCLHDRSRRQGGR